MYPFTSSKRDTQVEFYLLWFPWVIFIPHLIYRRNKVSSIICRIGIRCSGSQINPIGGVVSPAYQQGIPRHW
uniref:Uncharacterized protein n=1 Tax=uncultured marine virus TaxID=186617 RepID=A0A0F7L685_9VIRU|nr:hypothetical protein [uncultured marine virus]